MSCGRLVSAKYLSSGRAKEDRKYKRNFQRYLKSRRLLDFDLFITEKYFILLESIGTNYPRARWKRCVLRLYGNVLTKVLKKKVSEVASM